MHRFLTAFNGTKLNTMNIQDEVIKIHSKYGITEKANYEIQLLTERYAKEYHESEVKKLGISLVSQQRELLLAFINWVDKENYSFDIAETQPEFIERFLKANNCC